MNRRRLLKLLAVPGLAVAGGGLFMARARANPYYDGPASDHFDGLHFFNPGRPVTKGWREFLRWQWERARAPWPERYTSPEPDRPPARVEGLRIVHIGHASFLVQASGLNLLVDPVYSERASPVAFAGPKRVNAPGIAFDDLPPIDAVLVTHNHYDHLDGATLKRLWERDRPRILAPLGNDRIIRGYGADIAVESLDWEERAVIGERVPVTLVESYHWSARGMTDRRMALWGSYVIGTPDSALYHVGDTGYHDGAIFPRHRERHGPFRLAILPIGAYEPRWFMRDNHMDPGEAVAVLQALGAPEALGHHWGTFQLTDEAIEAPLAALTEACAKAGLPVERFRPARPGFVWSPERAAGA